MSAIAGSNERHDRLQSLDVLRFLAAISVMIYHLTYRPVFLGEGSLDLFPALQRVTKFGYLGVELFFLISGFVILWSASGRSAASYVASRVSRLVPSLWVAIALTSGILIAFGKVSGYSFKVIVSNMTLVAGYLGLPYVDGVYWTLQAEIKFYVLVFVLICIRQIQHIERWLLLWLIGLAIAYSPFSSGVLRSLVIFPYGSYFIGGSVFFLIWSRGISAARIAFALASLVLSVLCVRHEAPGFMNDDGSTAALSTACAVVVAIYLLFFAISTRRINLYESKWWFELGALTYPLYLLHNQIGRTFAEATASRWGVWPALLVGSAVPLLLALVLSKTVERRGCPWLRRLLLDGIKAASWRRGSAT